MAHPQGHPVIAQGSIIGIEISRLQRFAAGIMKNARKMRMIPEHDDIPGDPKLHSISLAHCP
jgi:hypothetical protein